MPTDVIRISDEAKERLEARKREHESFTDVVLRLTDRDDDVERFVGKYADVDLAAGVEAVKKRADRDFRESTADVRRQ
jgi:predicted CopG family antitoxin